MCYPDYWVCQRGGLIPWLLTTQGYGLLVATSTTEPYYWIYYWVYIILRVNRPKTTFKNASNIHIWRKRDEKQRKEKKKDEKQIKERGKCVEMWLWDSVVTTMGEEEWAFPCLANHLTASTRIRRRKTRMSRYSPSPAVTRFHGGGPRPRRHRPRSPTFQQISQFSCESLL